MAVALRRTQIRIPLRRPSSFSTTIAAAAAAAAAACKSEIRSPNRISSPVPEPEPYYRYKSNIRFEFDPERIASLFVSSDHPPEIYKIFVSRLARFGRHEQIERLLEPHLGGSSSDPNQNPKSEDFHIRIIILYAHAGMIDHAVRAFRRIPDFGLPHTQRSLCALLAAFLKNRKLDLVLKTFRSAPEDLQISPGITAHNIVLNALCYHGDLAGARKMLDEMEEKGMKPDVVSYNMLLNGYLKKGDRSGFKGVLKEMFDKAEELFLKKRDEPVELY